MINNKRLSVERSKCGEFIRFLWITNTIKFWKFDIKSKYLMISWHCIGWLCITECGYWILLLLFRCPLCLKFRFFDKYFLGHWWICVQATGYKPMYLNSHYQIITIQVFTRFTHLSQLCLISYFCVKNFSHWLIRIWSNRVRICLFAKKVEEFNGNIFVLLVII